MESLVNDFTEPRGVESHTFNAAISHHLRAQCNQEQPDNETNKVFFYIPPVAQEHSSGIMIFC